jgi:multicomponent K+:H+ antiporter subunit A
LLLLLLLSLPFFAALLLILLPLGGRRWPAWLAATAPIVGLALLAAVWPHLAAGEAATLHLPWLPAAGLDFDLHLDGLAALFVLLIYGIGLLVVRKIELKKFCKWDRAQTVHKEARK